MIAQNEVKVQGELANKTGDCTVSHKDVQGWTLVRKDGLQYKLNNGACEIIPYPTLEVKHI